MQYNLFFFAAVPFFLFSCGDGGKNNSPSESSDYVAPSVTSDPKANIEPVQPKPRYDLKEGNVYSYIVAISEEDRKLGKAAGDVLSYKYLGLQNEQHVVVMLGKNGKTISKSRCSDPCVIISKEDGEKVAYNPTSVIGAVFQDAIAGNLLVSRDTITKASKSKSKPKEREKIQTIPPKFHGEWRRELSSCGSEIDDTVLFVSSSELSFWESTSTPQSIVQNDPRDLLIGSLNEGEGQTWQSSFQMVLSQNGGILSIKDGDFSFDRYRCPVGQLTPLEGPKNSN